MNNSNVLTPKTAKTIIIAVLLVIISAGGLSIYRYSQRAGVGLTGQQDYTATYEGPPTNGADNPAQISTPLFDPDTVGLMVRQVAALDGWSLNEQGGQPTIYWRNTSLQTDQIFRVSPQMAPDAILFSHIDDGGELERLVEFLESQGYIPSPHREWLLNSEDFFVSDFPSEHQGYFYTNGDRFLAARYYINNFEDYSFWTIVVSDIGSFGLISNLDGVREL